MTQKLIKSSFHTVFPQSERENLWQILDKMLQTDLSSSNAIYIFNILYGIYQLIIRYETICREIILMTEIEDDSQKLRNNIHNMCQSTLYDGLQIAGISLENYEYLSKLSTGGNVPH